MSVEKDVADAPSARTLEHSPLTSKTEQVLRWLADDIVLGRLRPGTPISERALADSYKVSRVPVREALIRLERVGLIESSPGRGAMVKAISAESMRSLYQAREAIEGMAARLASDRAGRDHFTSFRKRLEAEINRKSPRADRLSEFGDELHAAVFELSRNSVLIEMAGSISDRVRICRRISYTLSPAGADPLEAAREHIKIAAAIDAGDSDRAEHEMRTHIAQWAEVLHANMPGDHIYG